MSSISPIQVVGLTGIGVGAPNEDQALTMTAVSSNPEVIPDPVVQYSKASTTATLTFAPLPNANGTALITVTVDDGQLQNHAVIRSFRVMVLAVNDLPALSDIPDQATDEGTPVFVSFRVTDVETASGNLVVRASSSNPGLVPDGNIILGGVGNSRNATISPLSGQSGSAVVTITVTDANGGEISDSFLLSVKRSDVLITITGISYQAGRAIISFTAANGLNYVLEYKNLLNDSSWTFLKVTQGSDGASMVNDDTAPDTSRIYRIRLE